MTTLRWESVDDTSTDIRYIGASWFADKGSLDAIGHNGPPFLSTLHGTNSSASFVLTFTGSRLRVMGTYTGSQNSSTVDRTIWTCFVDGVSRYSGSPNGNFNDNHLMFCDLPITDGNHTVSVNATVGRNQTFWFDKIQYVPSASVSLENKTIQLDTADPAIAYGYGWGSASYQTQTSGAQLSCNFTGVSVSWYGTSTTGNSTTGAWTIDDNQPMIFSVYGLGNDTTPVHNQKYFETPQYSMGPHKLVVTYYGDSSTTPLNLAYLVVQNGTLSRSTVPSPQTSNTQAGGTTNIGAIIGGSLGGAACLLIIILVFVYRHRRSSEIDRPPMAAVDSPLFHVPASQSPSSAFQYQTEGLVLLPNSEITSNLRLATRHEPSRQEEHPLRPRKLQNPAGTQVADIPPAYSLS